MNTYKQSEHIAGTDQARGTGDNVVLRMVGLGLIAGMRATFAPAFLSHFLAGHKSKAIGGSGLKFIQSPVASGISKGLAVLEILGDKKAAAPDRTVAPQVAARLASGALAGAIVAKANNQPLLKGVLIGSAAALVGTFGAFYLRKYVDRLPHVKDHYVGAAEDALGLAAGFLLTK